VKTSLSGTEARPVAALLDGSILNQLSDGVVLLDRTGKVIGLNLAAQPFLRRLLESRSTIKDAVERINLGKLSAPTVLTLNNKLPTTGDATEMTEVVLHRNGMAGFVCLFSPRANRSDADVGFPELLSKELRAVTQNAVHALDALADAASDMSTLEGLKDVRSLLGDVLNLTPKDRSRDEQVERVEILEFLRRLRPDLALRFPRLEGEIHLIQDGDIAPIYGHGGWLHSALNGLLHRVCAACPPGGHVQIELKQIGNHLTCIAKSFVTPMMGKKVPKHLIADPIATLDPLRHWKPLNLLLCQRVIEQHGGQLRLVAVDGEPYSPSATTTGSDDVASFTLTLPTGTQYLGATERCVSCPIAEQAQLYAKEFVQLVRELESSIKLSNDSKESI
jgi:signal transduction histidine kinase